MEDEKKDFMHISGDNDFQGRAKSTFAGLDSLEPQKKDEEVPVREVLTARRRRPPTVPDHVLHPAKWTKYSLEEDGSQDYGRMTANQLNKHAALDFLDELKERRESGGPQCASKTADNTSTIGTETTPTDDTSHGHSFSKSNAGDRDSDVEMRPLGKQKAGVNVMPEYVVGKTKAPTKDVKKIVHPKIELCNEKAVQISHLKESEDDSSTVAKAGDMVEDKNEETFKFAKRKHRGSKNIRKQTKSDDEDD